MFDNNTWDRVLHFLSNGLWQPKSIAILFLASGGLVAIFTGGFLSYRELKEKNLVEKCHYEQPISGQKEDNSVTLPNNLAIDINGAVANPGLYEFPADSRYSDVIAKAGGVTTRASKSFVATQLNLSKKISDQEKIYIPFEGEEKNTVTVAGEKVSINSSSLAKLQTLAGVGEVTANKIIAGRPYGKIEDLKNILSEKVFENNLNLLAL